MLSMGHGENGSKIALQNLGEVLVYCVAVLPQLSLGRGEHSPRWAAERMVRTFLDTSHRADYEVKV